MNNKITTHTWAVSPTAFGAYIAKYTPSLLTAVRGTSSFQVRILLGMFLVFFLQFASKSKSNTTRNKEMVKDRKWMLFYSRPLFALARSAMFSIWRSKAFIIFGVALPCSLNAVGLNRLFFRP
jgi:hypothetical protein